MDEQLFAYWTGKLIAAISHPAMTVFGLVVGVWGLVVILQSSQLVKGYFSTQYRGWFQGSTKYDGLVITYRAETVQQIGATEVTFWNGRNRTIRFEDFSKDFPLRVEVVGNVRVFDTGVLSKVPNSLTIRLGEEVIPPEITDTSVRIIPIEFDFLEPNEGVKVKLIHDGGYQAQINIAGRLAGARSVERLDSTGFLSVISSTKEKFFIAQGLVFLGALGVYCIYRLLTGDWIWLHGIGTICSVYLLMVPWVMFAKIKPIGLQGN